MWFYVQVQAMLVNLSSMTPRTAAPFSRLLTLSLSSLQLVKYWEAFLPEAKAIS